MGGEALIADSAAGLREALPDGGALLGIDLGTKTIGIATCDAGWRFATAGKTLPRGKFGRDREALAALIRERGIAGIVIGLPRNMDGSEGPRAQASRAYARNLAEAFSLPILLWDQPRQTRREDRQSCRRRDPARRDRRAGREFVLAAFERCAFRLRNRRQIGRAPKCIARRRAAGTADTSISPPKLEYCNR